MSHPHRSTPAARSGHAGPRARWVAALVLAVTAIHLAVLMWQPANLPPAMGPVERDTPGPATTLVSTPRPAAAPAVPLADNASTPSPAAPRPAAAASQPDRQKKTASPPERAALSAAENHAESTTTAGVAVGAVTVPSTPEAEPGDPAGSAATPVAAPPHPATAASASADAAPAGTVPGRVVWPTSSELRYEVSASRKGVTMSADSTLRLTVDGHRYDAQLTLQAWPMGSRVQTSRGELDAAWGLVPQRFGDKNRGKAEQATHFDRRQQPGALRFSANTPDAPLPAGTQDRLSVLFQLAAMLAGEPKRHGTGQHIRIFTAGAREAEWWDFEVMGTETLNLPAGRMAALRLLRTPTHPYDNRVELWMAPELGHLPVRVMWTQANGDVVDQRLSAHTP